ncbi:hypothetical protein [Hydrogenophaga sp. MI9]|uniref:hypothetical protein n=1 Tax=Hydrogenophaga sp. MI9 TaxID=3453719 RepID=UPI003EE9671A
MLTLITTVKLVVEIALLALLGQWVLGLIAGPRKDSNLFYQLLQQVGRPFVLLVGVLPPRFVLQRHHPLVAFLMLGFVWALVTVAKISHCLSVGVQLCR